MGAYLSPTAMGSLSPFVFLIMFAVAVFGKLVCALPAMYFLHDSDKALRVAIGMIPGGEVGLIIVGLALASGVIVESLYATLLITIIATAIIAPPLLEKAFKKTLST